MNEPIYFLIVLVLKLSLLKTVSSQCEIGQVCITDVTVSDCAPGQVLAPHRTVFNCCPGCMTPVPPEPDDTILDEEVCKEPSTCMPDGRYAPVQCKGDFFTGRCFCSDEHGKRIFGQMWRSEADEMTCACSRRRAELEASRSSVVSLHCTTTGDYEPLQCDDGICWCAEPKTGQPIFLPVLEADMKKLPCYTVFSIGDQYLRRCESLVQAMATISQEQSEHGTNFLGNPTTFCDYDGSYAAIQVRNGIAYCTDPSGEILGSWQTMSSDMASMNCNCARDTIMYFPANGMTVTEVCLANGNYQPNQNVGDVFYCVDTDGYAIEFLDEWPTDKCASYARV